MDCDSDQQRKRKSNVRLECVHCSAYRAIDVHIDIARFFRAVCLSEWRNCCVSEWFIWCRPPPLLLLFWCRARTITTKNVVELNGLRRAFSISAFTRSTIDTRSVMCLQIKMCLSIVIISTRQSIKYFCRICALFSCRMKHELATSRAVTSRIIYSSSSSLKC